MTQAIGVFDSGIGGLTVANAILDLLPAESILYYADTAHIPYGKKPLATIRQYSHQITKFLLAQNCKAIVVACNTASAAALDYLRDCFPETIIVGMEPAVKPAAEASNTKIVGVLATAGTFKSERYAQLMQSYAHGIQLIQDPCIGLVEKIEAGLTEDDSTKALLQDILMPMLKAGADTFVLGCTHYPLLRHMIESLLPTNAIIIDPAPAVVRQLARRLEKNQLLNHLAPKTQYLFRTSGSEDSLRQALYQYWPAEFSFF